MSLRSLLPFCLFLALVGCNSSPAQPPGHSSTADAAAAPPVEAGAIPDAGGGDASQAPPPCFTNPTTYLEIINACTDAQAVDKIDDLSPMNLADGGLQPLP